MSTEKITMAEPEKTIWSNGTFYIDRLPSGRFQLTSHERRILTFGESTEELSTLRAKNAELLEALKSIIAECPNPETAYGMAVAETARAALAKTEGKP